MKLLPILVILCSCTFGWGAGEGFESYLVGQEIGGQGQWLGNATITNEESAEGIKSLRIGSDQTASIKAGISEGVVFWDFYILPTFGQGEATLNVTGAKVGFRKNGNIGEILVFSNTSFLVAPFEVALLPESGEIETWLHFTIRVDRAKGVWDLYLDSKPIIASVKLGSDGGFQIQGEPGGYDYLDLVEERKTNPLFEDQDFDGMPDAEENAFGLNPFVDDRNADLDGDGVSNIAEFFSRTSRGALGNAAHGVSGYIFVDNAIGKDSFSGKQSYLADGDGPKASIKQAMIDASSGSVIFVMRGTGTYKEGTRGERGKRLTIKTAEGVIIQ